MAENIPPSFPSNHKKHIHVFMPSHGSHTLIICFIPLQKDLDLTLQLSFVELFPELDVALERLYETQGKRVGGLNRESGNSPVKGDKKGTASTVSVLEMGWSRALTCSCLLVMVCASAASEDEPDMLQREVSFDVEELLQGAGQLEADMTQREVGIRELWERIDFPGMEQREVSHEHMKPYLLKVLKERAGSRAADLDMTQREVTLDLDTDVTPRGRPMAGPRSFGDSRPSVLFPPGQPSPDNLQAICLHSSHRPRYPDYSLYRDGIGYLHRKADAVNRVESWYSACCYGNRTQQVQEVTLCCVTQAWEQALSTFCNEEFSVKTSHYHCCKKEGGARRSCFHSQSPNPNYLPTTQGAGFILIPELGFSFNPKTCHKSQPGPLAVRGQKFPQATPRDSDISFPPGRPTSDNIGLVCRLRKHRPLYNPKCLPRTGYGWLAHKSKAVNRLERGFKHCCKGQEDVLACAEGKWREVLDRFCGEEQKGRPHNSSCCDVGEGEERYTCFSSRAPHPAYDQELYSASAAPQTPTLGHICETYNIIRKKFPLALPIQNLAVQCCPLPADQRTACVQEKLVTLAERRCTPYKPSSVYRKCCPPSSQDAPKCLSGLLMNSITKAIKSPRLIKRKCPLTGFFQL